MDTYYDVVIIGGGAAGLSGALALGRARRSVLLIDGGQPRNAPAGHVHNYLGREGTPPGELVAIGRREVEQYGVEVHDGHATAATLEEDGSFVVEVDGRQVRARRLLVTTGLLDELPDVPGIAEHWGDTVLHCPYCHGWEVRDRAIGILGSAPVSLHQAGLFRQWSADITLFLDGGPVPGDEVLERFAARGIRVVGDAVAAWEDGGVRLVSGELVARDAIVVAPRMHARSAVLESLGIETTELRMGDHVVGTHVESGPQGSTSIPGVRVAGNVTTLNAQVISAAAAGLEAAAMLNAELVEEDTDRAVELRRMFSQQAWDERYRASDGHLWSGRPNPVLVAEAAGLRPGRALDVGCGEGGDALWLAERGWDVTGFDVSSVALERAADHARERGLSVRWQHADLLTESPAPGAFDLVCAHFLHLPTAERTRFYGELAAAVAPGGTLLIAAHAPSDLRTALHRPPLPEMFFTADELVADLDPDTWEIVVAEQRPRIERTHDGDEVTVEDTVLRARRRA
jgi:thioredoxin reductase/SAM-dependent methyltransferase